MFVSDLRYHFPRSFIRQHPPDSAGSFVRYALAIGVASGLKAGSVLQYPAGGAIQRIASAAADNLALADPAAAVDQQSEGDRSLLIAPDGVHWIIVGRKEGREVGFRPVRPVMLGPVLTIEPIEQQVGILPCQKCRCRKCEPEQG